MATLASMKVWNGIWKKYYGMEWSMEDFLWYGMEDGMEKIVGIEYGKIIFHSISLHALLDDKAETNSQVFSLFKNTINENQVGGFSIWF